MSLLVKPDPQIVSSSRRHRLSRNAIIGVNRGRSAPKLPDAEATEIRARSNGAGVRDHLGVLGNVSRQAALGSRLHMLRSASRRVNDR